jgi:predicted nucleic acid-binding protein
MPLKIFLDTNIFLDLLLKRTGELDEIKLIFDAVETKFLEIYISESVLITTIYFLQKQNIDALSVARLIIQDLQILPFKKEIFDYPIENFKDTEDGFLYFLALDAKMDFFITRNIYDFKNHLKELPVFYPKQFIELNLHK